MIRAFMVLTLITTLSACGSINRETEDEPEPQAGSIEEAAINSGAIPDLGELSLAGRYEQRSELGSDKFCAVSADGNTYKIGIVAAFGPTAQCEGQGLAILSGETVSIELDSEEPCNFKASFDGVEIRMPGTVPEGCASYCTDRASFSGVSMPLVEEGDDSAKQVDGRNVDKLCG